MIKSKKTKVPVASLHNDNDLFENLPHFLYKDVEINNEASDIQVAKTRNEIRLPFFLCKILPAHKLHNFWREYIYFCDVT